MHDRDWTATVAAFTALALTAGVWLWPGPDTASPAPRDTQAAANDADMARWREEARRWDGPQRPDAVQLSATGDGSALVR